MMEETNATEVLDEVMKSITIFKRLNPGVITDDSIDIATIFETKDDEHGLEKYDDNDDTSSYKDNDNASNDIDINDHNSYHESKGTHKSLSTTIITTNIDIDHITSTETNIGSENDCNIGSKIDSNNDCKNNSSNSSSHINTDNRDNDQTHLKTRKNNDKSSTEILSFNYTSQQYHDSVHLGSHLMNLKKMAEKNYFCDKKNIREKEKLFIESFENSNTIEKLEKRIQVLTSYYVNEVNRSDDLEIENKVLEKEKKVLEKENLALKSNLCKMKIKYKKKAINSGGRDPVPVKDTYLGPKNLNGGVIICNLDDSVSDASGITSFEDLSSSIVTSSTAHNEVDI